MPKLPPRRLLAVAAALALVGGPVEAMGGSIDLGVSALGGLAVRLSWSGRRAR